MQRRKSSIRYFAALLLLLFIRPVLPASPGTLSYQGYLTDSAGAPLNGDLTVRLNIYNVSAGGIPLWKDKRLVTFKNGLFSIELGGLANPFPPGLFDQPAWLGMGVETDAEMVPRRPITAAGFAFKAADADTLEGIRASALDQSAHLADTGNPHRVTAAQTGAADAATLSAHISDTANPHSVTAAQTGAASSTAFDSHRSDSAAHHPRFTSGEAVAAMGAKTSNNPLNHDRYTDTDAFAAVLAAGGPGSGLDADLVDGLEASEIIDAAQDEVRTPISSLPFTISTPGSYYLTGNLDGSAGGIDITTDNVTLDLMGFTMDGSGSVSDYGIDLGGSNHVTIRHGVVRNFGLTGIYQSPGLLATASIRIVDIQVVGNGNVGSGYAQTSGIFLSTSGNHIERCTTALNKGTGIYTGGDARVLHNNAYSNGYGGIFANDGSVLTGNTARDNADAGIVGASVTLIGNAASRNGSDGIRGGTGAIVRANTASANTGTGIVGDNGASLIGNSANRNGRWGIAAYGYNLVKDNTLYDNNQSSAADTGGLYLVYRSRAIDNILGGNSINNILVAAGDNTIENNHVSASDTGIRFVTSGNFWANNRASGNTTDFANTAGQTDGGGNISF